MKNLLLFLLIFINFPLMAQEPTPLKDEPGTWKYSYLDDANTKMYSQQFGMTAAESVVFKTKLDRLVEILHRNPVFAEPRGFNALVESRPFAPHDYKKNSGYYGYVGEINLRMPMWFESKGRKYTQNIEPPRTTVYLNYVALLKNSTFSVSSLKSGKGGGTNAGKTVNQRDVAEMLEDICKPMHIEQLAPGVFLYDYAIVFMKPDAKLYLPLSVGEAFSRMIAYYEAAAIEEPYNEFILTGIKEDFARYSPEQLKLPAYFGGTSSGITAEKNNDPLMLFNNDFFDHTLPKTAVQIIVFPINADYFREQSDFAPNSVSYKRINQFHHSLDIEAIVGLLD